MANTSLYILATAVGPHLYWITSRAAGIAALLLASISVCVGLLMGGRLRARRPDLRSPTRRCRSRRSPRCSSTA